MSNYYYDREYPRNAKSWIDQLAIINNPTGYCSHYNEIHFTIPKKAVAATNAQPHISFIGGGYRCHYYLVKSGNSWVPQLGAREYSIYDYDEEMAIARKVISDMLERGWINQPLGKVNIDAEGFQSQKKNTKKQQMRSWQV